ncbi:Uu.00g088170.m01.CDS01 [Anthostomella pinea]|uniref:Uu.00g088170.m01.CDS01 n=1 Tax=Anthostomella pinea TaxID=933095 RepID=A0AAI8VNE5_9PEZI|nr:Uu.00g088170.m01.CDS01 [Anthostomella pinea]
MAYRGVDLILCPYHVGKQDQGVGNGPRAILDAGIREVIESHGISFSTTTIDPVNDFEGEIGRSFELLRRIAAAVKAARASRSFPIVLAGNCNSSVGVFAGLTAGAVPHGELGIIWHDAHDDYHNPDTLESGYFDAMGVSMLTGESWKGLTSSIPGFQPMRKDRVVFCGVRDVSDSYAKALQSILGQLEAPRRAIVHWDLDSLDSGSCGKANRFAASGGLTGDDLQGIAAMLPKTIIPEALTLASFDPSCSERGGAVIAGISVKSISKLLQVMAEEGQLLRT